MKTEHQNETEKMLCPCCEKELVITHQGRYESLGEHIGDPNGTPTMKDGYQCTNEYCIANNLGGVWIEGGEFFMKPPEGVKWTVAHDAIEKCSVSGTYYALNSWSHYYHVGKRAVEKRTKKVEIGKYRFNIIPKEKGRKYSNDKCYMPRRFGWKIDIWKKTDCPKGSYFHVIPVWRMVKFSIHQFNRNYRNWKQNPNDYSLRKCYEEMNRIRWGNTKDERLYAKIAEKIIKIFYYGKYVKIHMAYNSK